MEVASSAETGAINLVKFVWAHYFSSRHAWEGHEPG
jgi:hypothetical protein